MSITIYSKHIPENIKDKIIGDNVKRCLEDGAEEYIKKEMGIEDGL